MTAKRFTLTYEKLGKYFSIGIVDHETKEPFDDTTYEFHQCSFKDSKDEMEDLCLLLNELHDEKQSVIDWIDKKIEEIKPYNSELCRATLLGLKEYLE